MENMLTVLVVDDSKLAQLMLRKAITSFAPGYNIIMAKDGEEAFDLYQKNTPDIAMIDYNMPGINGIELIQKLRTIDKEMPIALCTANIQTTIQNKAKNLNVAFIAKPVTNETVAQFLEKNRKTVLEH
ncbi:MAG: response regulator [Sneathiella sp.]|nr:response regulator [Sneathiella sp.]